MSAVFVKGDGGGDVVGVGEAPDRDFHDGIDEGEFLFGEAEAFVADDEGGAAGEAVVVEADGVGGLLEADEGEAGGFQLFQDGRQGAVNFDLNLVVPVAGDGFVDFCMAASDEAGDSAAAGSADDVGEVDVAAHGGAADHEFSRSG